MSALDITRRRFLAGSGAACAAGLLGPLVRPQLAFAAQREAVESIVLVVLDGGLDGLSALVPVGDDHYGRRRLLTRILEGRTIGVSPDFALHPSLAPVAELWRDGLVAAVPAVGNVTGSRSHLTELAHLASGLGGRDDGTGWLGRHIASRPGGSAEPLRGISSGDRPARELRGDAGAFHIPDLANAGLLGWDKLTAPAAERALADVYSAAGAGLAPSAALAFDALDRLRSSGAAQLEPRAAYPSDPWAAQLQQVAKLIRSDVGMEAAVVTFSGWDTHTGQGNLDGRLASMLDRLARALAAFVADIHDRLERTTVVVVSEFGRRVQENASGGTDHGRGGVAFVLGRGINGGVHGTWPGLDDSSLDRGDVAEATDIRSVLAEVVRGRLGNPNLAQVFPGFDARPLGIA